MVDITNIEVTGWEAAIRGMRNPMNSWSASDSWFGCRQGDYGHTEGALCHETCKGDCCYCIGKNDLDLMKRLVKAGTDHSKFMRMIVVTFDLTAPLYLWKEVDTYKVGTVRNSCSTMHKIMSKMFTIDDFSCDHLSATGRKTLQDVIAYLNLVRTSYLNTADKDIKKDLWWDIIQLLPSSYNQKATMLVNYAVLSNWYHARKNHKLDEWHKICDWIKLLPASELITSEF